MTSGETKTMKKNLKRKNYPKKALTAYNIFFKETREKILIEHGKTNFQEMVRKIAALWKEITHAEKVRFEAIAASDLARYNEEVKMYEKQIVLENEANKRQKSVQNYIFAPTSGSTIHKKTDNEGEAHAHAHAIRNAQLLDISRSKIMAEMGQLMASRSVSNPTLTPSELELAMRERLIDSSSVNTGGRRLSNASVGTNISGGRCLVNSAAMNLCGGNAFGMGFRGGDRVGSSGDIAIIGNRRALGLSQPGVIPVSVKKELDLMATKPNLDRVTSASDRALLSTRLGLDRDGLSGTYGIGSKEKFDRGVDSMTMTMPRSGKCSASSFKEEEVQSLVHEAKMRFGKSGICIDQRKEILPFTRENSLGIGTNSSINVTELQRRLNLRNELTRSNHKHQLILKELISSARGPPSENEIVKRMMNGGNVEINAIGLQRRMSMERSREIQIRLAMMQDKKLIEEKLRKNTLEEIRLREARLSQQQQLISQWVNGAAGGTPWNKVFNASR